MTPEFITGFFFDAIKTAISLAAPMLLSGLAVGLLVSIFNDPDIYTQNVGRGRGIDFFLSLDDADHGRIYSEPV